MFFLHNILNFLQYEFENHTSFLPYGSCSRFHGSVGSLGSPCIFVWYFSPSFSLVSKDVIELIGVVEECYPNTTFQVRITSLEAKDHQLLCHLAGRMRVNKVRILPGDRVRLEMTPYDLKKGRIVYRFRADDPAGNPPKAIPATAPLDSASTASPTPIA